MKSFPYNRPIRSEGQFQSAKTPAKVSDSQILADYLGRVFRLSDLNRTVAR